MLKHHEKHLFSTSELQRGCCAGSKKLVRHFENASDWNVFATSRSKFEKMAYETCSKNVQAHPEVVFRGEKKHIRVILCLCKGCKNAYGNRCYEEPDRPFLTHSSYRVCRRSVYTTLSTPLSPHTMAKLGARERHGMLGLLLQLGYIPIVTFAIPKSQGHYTLRCGEMQIYRLVSFAVTYYTHRVEAGSRFPRPCASALKRIIRI